MSIPVRPRSSAERKAAQRRRDLDDGFEQFTLKLDRRSATFLRLLANEAGVSLSQAASELIKNGYNYGRGLR